jgi:hypothetical protein
VVGEAHADGLPASDPARRLLFCVTRRGALRVATQDRRLAPQQGDTVIWLAAADRGASA